MQLCFLIVLIITFFMPLTMSTISNQENQKSHSNATVGIHVAAWNAEEVGDYVSIIIFIIFAGLAKVVFHHAHFLSSRLPESW